MTRKKCRVSQRRKGHFRLKHKVCMVSDRSKDNLITSTNSQIKLECSDNEVYDIDVHMVSERSKDTWITASSDSSVKLECPDNEIHDTDDFLDNDIVGDTVTDEVCLHENHQLVAENIKVAHVEGQYKNFWEIPNVHHGTVTCLSSRDDKYKKFRDIPDVHHGTVTSVSSGDDRIDMVDSDGHQFYIALDHSYLYQPNINLIEFVLEKSKDMFDMLKKDCQKNLNEHGPFELVKSSKYVRYVNLYDTDNPTVKTCITIYANFQAEIIVHGVLLPKSHAIWDTPGLPIKFLSTQHVQELLETASCYQVCIGNPDPDFNNNLPLGCYSNKPSSTCAGYREEDLGAYNKDFHYKSSIRSSYCSLLSKVERCKSCQVYRRSLNKRKSRLKTKVPPEEINWLSYTKGNTVMTESEKVTKLKQLTALLTDLKTKNKNLEKKLQVKEKEKKLQVNEIEKKLQVNETEKKLKVNETEKKLQVNEIEKKLQVNETEKKLQVNATEKKLQVNETEKKLQVNETEKKLQVNETEKKLQVNEIEKNLQVNEVRIQIIRPSQH
ncbi:uncharacterized protein LOC127704353 isoform X2 [Mytilus californianus]|uniref:uncharacterized protein LOC127704353 isoform X2 n=1 Tax=Mytilus californianus TaxID=6549 RepID=UPI0022477354|nr:uncharacterized protein LOC127704353 isoform X2 [Mytilus californianus]